MHKRNSVLKPLKRPVVAALPEGGREGDDEGRAETPDGTELAESNVHTLDNRN